MGNIFYQDFRDFIQALNDNQVEYILVGGYSVILHGGSRTTGDMDIWVRKEKKNYIKLVKAFTQFGMPVFDMTESNFLHNENLDVFTFGKAPVSIDIMTNVKGVNFEECIKAAQEFEDDGLKIRLIHVNHLIQAKTAAGRSKDISDIDSLTKE